METYIYQPSEEELQLRPEDLPQESEEAGDAEDPEEQEALMEAAGVDVFPSGASRAGQGVPPPEGQDDAVEDELGMLLRSSSGISPHRTSMMRTFTGGCNSKNSAHSRSAIGGW